MPTYQKSEVAWFYTKTSPRWELSNMSAEFPIYWPLERKPENLWYSTEQLYQASKYPTTAMCLPSPTSKADPCVRNRIRKDKTPLGSKITQECAVEAGLVRADWKNSEMVCLKSMAWVLELKLHFYPDTFGRVLRDTGDQPIVEISKEDEFWACLNGPNGELRGENYLGRLLVRLRGRMPQVANGEFTFPDGHILP